MTTGQPTGTPFPPRRKETAMSDDLVKLLRGEGDAHFRGMVRDRRTIGSILTQAAARIEELSNCVAVLEGKLAEARAKGARETRRCPQCEARENTFLESTRIKQQCRHCGYQSIDWLGENAACPMLDCNGGMLTVPNRAEVKETKGDTYNGN